MVSTEKRAYLDTSALAKWYLNEVGSEAFVDFLQSLDSALISSLSVTEMRSSQPSTSSATPQPQALPSRVNSKDCGACVWVTTAWFTNGSGAIW